MVCTPMRKTNNFRTRVKDSRLRKCQETKAYYRFLMP